ncbi:MAG: hypothetical protein JSV91_14810 [Phycisphaerales bacterium]|nr:MAG: hypothetical protein JSV91_14810 [Phycisphaerales bacterium]
MRRTALDILRPDPGWLFVIAGLAICTVAVLTPAQQNLHELREKLAGLRAEEAHAAARLQAYSDFLDDLDRDDPQLIRRLAASQLNLMPAGDEPVLLTASGSSAVVDWIDRTVPVKEVNSRRWPQTLLTRLTAGPHRRWLFAGGGLCVFIGLLIAPTRPRRHISEADRPRLPAGTRRALRIGAAGPPPMNARRESRPAAEPQIEWEQSLADLPAARFDRPARVIVEADEPKVPPEVESQSTSSVRRPAHEAESGTPKADRLEEPTARDVLPDEAALLDDPPEMPDGSPPLSPETVVDEDEATEIVAAETGEESIVQRKAVGEIEEQGQSQQPIEPGAHVETDTPDETEAAEEEDEDEAENEEAEDGEEWEYEYEYEYVDADDDEESEDDPGEGYEYVYEYEYVDEAPDDDDEYEIVEEDENEDEERPEGDNDRVTAEEEQTASAGGSSAR